MAKFNEILVGRYNRFLQKLLGMKGGPPASQLASEIGVAFPLFNGAENRNLEAWDRFWFNLFTAGVAAQIVALMVRNPSGSNAVAVFEKIKWVCQNTGDQAVLSYGAQTTDLTTIITPSSNFNLDPRGRPGSSLIVSRSQAAGLLDLNTIRDVDVGIANTNYDKIITDIQEFPLLPGFAVQMRNIVVANAFQVEFMWRERFLEDSERT